MTGLYDAIGDVAKAIVALPSERERLAAAGFLAEELRGYLGDLGASECREIVARMVNELQAEA